MSKHTAGPWRLSTRRPDLDGVNVCFEIDADNRINIASGQSQEHIGPDSICEDECLANARLIAAAPDLYALAQRVARLNPDAGEIGPGMLAQLVAEARRIVGGSMSEALRLAEGLEDSWGYHLADKVAAELRRLHAENERLREALSGLLTRDERNTCQHDSTHRGGALWTICDSCGAKWADDEGGMPEWQDPKEWIAAREALK